MIEVCRGWLTGRVDRKIRKCSREAGRDRETAHLGGKLSFTYSFGKYLVDCLPYAKNSARWIPGRIGVKH